MKLICYRVGAMSPDSSAICMQLIAHQVTQRIIDVFESIDVQIENCDRGIVAGTERDRLFQAVIEQAAIRQLSRFSISAVARNSVTSSSTPMYRFGVCRSGATSLTLLTVRVPPFGSNTRYSAVQRPQVFKRSRASSFVRAKSWGINFHETVIAGRTVGIVQHINDAERRVDGVDERPVALFTRLQRAFQGDDPRGGGHASRALKAAANRSKRTCRNEPGGVVMNHLR